MARIAPLRDEEIPPQSQPEFERQLAAHGRVTNMKRTLARNPVAFEALMWWYPLHDEVSAFLGHKSTILFAYAVSDQADCLICSTYMRRLLIESGNTPDAMTLSGQEQAVVDFGRQLARDSNGVGDALMGRLTAFLTSDQLVALTAFGALMLATNVFINALQVDLDEYLLAYRKPESLTRAQPHG
jgi:alkylhydroperoxidase family enzyme